MLARPYDLLVIGSGFGGAVVACRAAQAGLRVAILERGPWLTAERHEAVALGAAPVFRADETPGVLDLHRLSGLIALGGSAVGGGSNIYTAVTLRPPPEAFAARWPTGLNRDTLAPYYERVEQMIAPTPMPIALPRTTALETLAGMLGAQAVRLPLSMDWPATPEDLAVQPDFDGVYRELSIWLLGGRAARKRTLVRTYLARAQAAGADILALREVRVIEPAGRGYRVHCRAGDEAAPPSWHDETFAADRVVVAAGTLGTVRLLLRCRDVLRTLPRLSGALGERFFTNGDFGGLLVSPKPDLPHDSGPPVTGWLDLWPGERMYLMETGLVPFDFGGFSGLLNPARWFGGLRLSPAARCTWSFGVMGYADSPGCLVLGRGERLMHQYNTAAGAYAFLDRSFVKLRELAAAAGAKLIAPPGIIARRLPITVHPLGGAAMADSPEGGVADSRGEVFGYPGLFIADGSLIPAPTGVPPSMTIAALAERIAEGLRGRR